MTQIKKKIILTTICAIFLASCGKTELYSGLGEREANEMVAVLSNAGIKSNKKRDADGAFALTLDDSDFAVSMEILSRLGYPEEKYEGYNEIYKGNRLVSSPAEERSRLSFATNQELARTLTDIDGITKANVHIVLPQVTPLGDLKGDPTAAVSVHYSRGTNPSRLIPAIKRIISHSVKDLKRENVMITFHETPDLAADPRIKDEGRSTGFFGSVWKVLFILMGLAFLFLGLRLITSQRAEKSQE